MWFRVCKQVSCFCLSLGFVLGGSLSVGLVIYILDYMPRAGEDSYQTQYTPTQGEVFQKEIQTSQTVSNQTEHPEQTSFGRESHQTEFPQIQSESFQTESQTTTIVTYQTEHPQKTNFELSKWKGVDHFINLKSLNNMPNVTHKLPVRDATLAIVGGKLWSTTWSAILYVYNKSGKFIKTIKAQTVIHYILETDDGDIVAYGHNNNKYALIVIDNNGNLLKLIYNDNLDHISHHSNVIYGLWGNKVLKFRKIGDMFIKDRDIILKSAYNSRGRMYAGENNLVVSHREGHTVLIYSFSGKLLHNWAILSSKNSSNWKIKYHHPVLCGVESNGVALVLDYYSHLQLCSEEETRDLVTLNLQGAIPRNALIDPLENVLWVTSKKHSSRTIYLHSFVAGKN